MLRLNSGSDGKAFRCASDTRRQRGFSLIELCVVLAILLIVGGMLFINSVTAIRNIRLQTSASNYANLLQQARLRAITDDNFYTVQTGVSQGIPIAFVDLAKSGAYAAGDPMMTFSTGVSAMPLASGPSPANLEAQFLPTGQAGTVVTDAPPAFGPRGLPCKVSGGICPYITVGPGGGVATSYIAFFQNAQSTKWEAVTISPAGRVRIWSYNGTAWSPMN